MRLYFAESLKGISMTPSSVPIFNDSNVFTIIDLGMDASIRGMHMEFFTTDILFIRVSLLYKSIMFYIDFAYHPNQNQFSCDFVVKTRIIIVQSNPPIY